MAGKKTGSREALSKQPIGRAAAAGGGRQWGVKERAKERRKIGGGGGGGGGGGSSGRKQQLNTTAGMGRGLCKGQGWDAPTQEQGPLSTTKLRRPDWPPVGVGSVAATGSLCLDMAGGKAEFVTHQIPTSQSCSYIKAGEPEMPHTAHSDRPSWHGYPYRLQSSPSSCLQTRQACIPNPAQSTGATRMTIHYTTNGPRRHPYPVVVSRTNLY